MKLYDNHNRLTLRAIYEDCKSDMNADLKKIENKADSKRVISYREFSVIIRMYLKLVFQNLINGYSLSLYNKFGVLRVVKTSLIRYNPITYSFKRENGKVIREKKKLKHNSGYWYFLFWDCAKKYRHFRLKPDINFKRAYMKEVKKGMDYLDISLYKYGRNASDNYVDKIL